VVFNRFASFAHFHSI